MASIPVQPARDDVFVAGRFAYLLDIVESLSKPTVGDATAAARFHLQGKPTAQQRIQGSVRAQFREALDARRDR